MKSMPMPMLFALVLAAAAAACGSTQQPATQDPAVGSAAPPADPLAGPGAQPPPRSAFDQRRDAACKQLAPKLTACAVEDAKADLAAGKLTQQQFNDETQKGVLDKNTSVFVEKCTGWHDMSSRQVRVLEVCYKSEPDCGPLRDCLKNLEAVGPSGK